MRWIALVLVLLISGSASAQVGQSVWLPITKPPSGGGGSASCSTATNTEVQTWGSNVDTQAGSAGAVSSTQCGYVDTLVTSLKAAVGTPLSSQVSRLWIATSADTTAANIQAQFKVDLIHGSLLDFTSANIGARLAHTTGYTPNGTTEFIKTGFIPSSSDTGVYATNSATYGVFDLSSPGVDGVIIMGAYDGTNIEQLLPSFSPLHSDMWIHSTAGIGLNTATDNFGMHIPSRTSSSVVVPRQYTSVTSPAWPNQSDTVTALATVQFYVSARNNAGTADTFSPDSVGAVIIGRGYTNTEAYDISQALNALNTSVGAAHW